MYQPVLHKRNAWNVGKVANAASQVIADLQYAGLRFRQEHEVGARPQKPARHVPCVGAAHHDQLFRVRLLDPGDDLGRRRRLSRIQVGQSHHVEVPDGGQYFRQGHTDASATIGQTLGFVEGIRQRHSGRADDGVQDFNVVPAGAQSPRQIKQA